MNFVNLHGEGGFLVVGLCGWWGWCWWVCGVGLGLGSVVDCLVGGVLGVG